MNIQRYFGYLGDFAWIQRYEVLLSDVLRFGVHRQWLRIDFVWVVGGFDFYQLEFR